MVKKRVTMILFFLLLYTKWRYIIILYCSSRYGNILEFRYYFPRYSLVKANVLVMEKWLKTHHTGAQGRTPTPPWGQWCNTRPKAACSAPGSCSSCGPQRNPERPLLSCVVCQYSTSGTCVPKLSCWVCRCTCTWNTVHLYSLPLYLYMIYSSTLYTCTVCHLNSTLYTEHLYCLPLYLFMIQYTPVMYAIVHVHDTIFNCIVCRCTCILITLHQHCLLWYQYIIHSTPVLSSVVPVYD